MKIKCVKLECQVCGKVLLIQLFFRTNGELSYSRARHYIGKKEGKPQFEHHPQSIESLKTLLKAQSISLTTDKVESGQAGQAKNADPINSGNSLVQEKTRGCRLAWSRLVDLGSIDSGSNPGSPIQGSELFRVQVHRDLIQFWLDSLHGRILADFIFLFPKKMRYVIY